MKKNLLKLTTLCFVVLLLHSCGTYYEYIQVLNTKPVNNLDKTSKTNGGLLYEDANCAVFYKFWGNGGNAGFEFYNKTDQIIYLDLSKTFFIKNGVAYDYYENKTITNTESSNTAVSITSGYGLAATSSYSASISQYYAGHLGYPTTPLSPQASSASIGTSKSLFASLFGSKTLFASTGHSTSVATTKQPILSIPPKSSKFIKNYHIISNEIVSCDLKYYPENHDKISFNEENSPITFANYITFKIGESSNLYSIENKFYISEIANYVEQNVTNYVKRSQTCENILAPDQIKNQKYALDVYDPYILVGDETSFYKTYKIFSKSQLYNKKETGFVWNNAYNGYINISNTQILPQITSSSTNSIVTPQAAVDNEKVQKLERVHHQLSRLASVLNSQGIYIGKVYSIYNKIYKSTPLTTEESIDNLINIQSVVLTYLNSQATAYPQLEKELKNATTIEEQRDIFLSYYK